MKRDMVPAVLLVGVAFLLGLGGCENYRPIIGMYLVLQTLAVFQHTRPLRLSAGIVSEELSSGKASYIAASYVKYIESAGARVVPVLYPTLSFLLLKQ